LPPGVNDAAARIAYREVPTRVLSVGDYDLSGLSILNAAAEDVAAFVEEMGGTPPNVKRIAVTEEQITLYGLAGPRAPEVSAARWSETGPLPTVEGSGGAGSPPPAGRGAVEKGARCTPRVGPPELSLS
jgi:hypothetical protein